MANEAIEPKFANAGLFLNGAYGLWAIELHYEHDFELVQMAD